MRGTHVRPARLTASFPNWTASFCDWTAAFCDPTAAFYPIGTSTVTTGSFGVKRT